MNERKGTIYEYNKEAWFIIWEDDMAQLVDSKTGKIFVESHVDDLKMVLERRRKEREEALAIEDNGDSLPHPKVTKQQLDLELDQMYRQREKAYFVYQEQEQYCLGDVDW